ncbi:MAG: Fic family protein [Streptococcaceae bacterium]|jgi:fido (protein-threonine AMPylation protein)|nr:Fic family protein [Streptococcaceae bacterium]
MNFGEDKPYSEESEKQPYQVYLDLWDTSFGLQETDNLTPSSYMRTLAEEQAEGTYGYQEVEQKLDSYYSTEKVDKSTEEADYASLRIAEILSNDSFSFSPATLLSYHRRLFSGIETFKYPVGQIRSVNITKAEKVLNGDTVIYADFRDIKETLNWDFEQEKTFSYQGMNKTDMAHHVMNFLSGIWQIHPFREGNTRTTAVFGIKYLRNLGFEIDNTPFKNNAKFFRDALVMANAKRGMATDVYLRKFTENLLLSGKNELVIGGK